MSRGRGTLGASPGQNGPATHQWCPGEGRGGGSEGRGRGASCHHEGQELGPAAAEGSLCQHFLVADFGLQGPPRGSMAGGPRAWGPCFCPPCQTEVLLLGAGPTSEGAGHPGWGCVLSPSEPSWDVGVGRSWCPTPTCPGPAAWHDSTAGAGAAGPVSTKWRKIGSNRVRP